MYSLILEPAENGFIVNHCGEGKIYLFETATEKPTQEAFEYALDDAIDTLKTRAKNQLIEYLKKQQKEFEDTENAK